MSRTTPALPRRVLRRAVTVIIAVLVSAGTIGWLTPAREAAAAAPIRPTTLVVTTDPDVPAVDRAVAVATAQREFDRMAAYWDDISNGTVTFELAQEIVWSPGYGKCSSTSAQRSEVYTRARAESGFTSGPLKHIIVNVGNCTSFGGWGGGSNLTSGGSLYIEDPSWQEVWAHEIGHTLGYGHANLLSCTDGSVDAPIGTETGANPNCRSISYGDGPDIMATSSRTLSRGFSAPNAIKSGFYTEDEYLRVSGRDYDETITIDSRDTEDAPIAVQIRDPRGSRVYYVEYVVKAGYDAGRFGSRGDVSEYDGVDYRKNYGVRMLRFDTNGTSTLVLPAPLNSANERPTFWSPGQIFTSDSDGVEVEVVSQTATTATLNVRLTGLPVPEAQPDTVTTDVNQSVQLDPLENDDPAPSSSLDLTSVVFPTDGQPTGSTVSTDGRSLTMPDEGTYTADPITGAVSFAPATGFVGEASPITYQVSDDNGETDTATITVTVLQAAPTAVDDASTTAFETASGPIDVLENDLPPADGEIDATSVVFPDDDQPTGAVVTDQRRSLEVPDEGSYVIDPQTGEIAFTPVDDFSGEASAVTYQVGSVNGRSATAALTVTVADDTSPIAADETRVTAYETDVTIDVAADASASQGRTIDPTSVIFPDSTAADQKSITVTGQGTYVVDDEGVVTFTPAVGFSGPADPVTYQISDSEGETATAQISVTVGDAPPTPTAVDDTVDTAFRTPAVIDVVANDTLPDDAPGTVDRTSVRFTDGGGRELVVADEGTWTIDADTGVITFTPEDLFVGEATAVTYEVSNSLGDAGPATAEVTVTVIEPDAPVGVDDVGQSAVGRVIDLHVLENDTSAVDFVSSSLRFPTGGQPTGADVSANGRTLTVPGQGTYTIDTSDDEGRIDFRPAAGFAGTTTPITYLVDDELGRTASATVTVEVDPAPAIGAPDRPTTEQGEPITIDPLANDTPSTGATFVRGSLTLFEGEDDGSPSTLALQPVDTVTVAGEGTWRVTDDGRVRFTPVADFVGTTTPVTYEANDSIGGVAHSTMSVVVTADPEPSPTPTPTDPAPTDPTDPTPTPPVGSGTATPTPTDPTGPEGTESSDGESPSAGNGGGVGGQDDGGLANTGGVGLGPLLFGAALTAAGAGLLWRRHRPSGRRVG